MSSLRRGLAEAVSADSILDSEADLLAYSYDGALDRGAPEAVVLPRTAEEVSRVVDFCARTGTALTARGAGTNLSGGCIPLKGGVVLSTARMTRILSVDTAAGCAVAEPGVVNFRLQRELEPLGLFYAPDPASFRVSTLGGNIAENAGGPRCLKYGVTTNHVLALEAVMADGSLERFSVEDAGPEIMSLLVGAEGTLGVLTKAWLNALPEPRTVETLLAGFRSIEAAVECVAAVIAAGILPRVLEALDRVTIDSVEQYNRAGYPKTEAALLVEVDGEPADVRRQAAEIERLCRAAGSVEFRRAEDSAQRERLWEGRRGAYAAMARLAPNVLVEDGVVPRDKLPEICRRIGAITRRDRLTAGLLFHAGDGNIHPNIAYDERDARLTATVKAAGHEILQACVELGGSLSGEHGIGLDKRDAMRWLMAPEALELFRRVKAALDPAGILNPDKIIPLAGVGSGARAYLRPPGLPPSEEALRLAQAARRCAESGRMMAVRGSGSRLREQPAQAHRLETAGLCRLTDLDRGNGTLTVEAGIGVSRLHAALRAKGLYLRLPDDGGTLGGQLATKPWTGCRDDVLGMRVLLADGTIVELGGKVVKNVAGYDLPRLLLGSWGSLALILEVTLKIYAFAIPVPQPLAPKPFAAGRRALALKAAFDPRGLLWSPPSASGGR